MLSDFSDSLSDNETTVQPKVKKKRKITGKMTDVMKKLRATTQIGEDCKCTRFKYFQIISVEE